MDRLLSILQQDIPLTPKPFRKLARELGLNEEILLSEIGRLKREKILRQISPIFDTKRAGYDSSLVAFSVPTESIEKVAELINSHPGVSHNYERSHTFNIWFTLAVPPDSELGLEETVRLLAEEGRVKRYLILRTKKTFKIGVRLNYRNIFEREESPISVAREPTPVPLEEIEKLVIKHSQEDLPLTTRPFLEVAGKVGISEEEILEILRSLKEKKVMRRFSAILYHRRVGFKANGMVVWRVDGERVDSVGRYLSTFKAVSHCYERTVEGDGWEYNLFSMVHGRSKEEVESFAHSVAREVGLEDFLILYSSREFKKRRIKLFSEEFYAWEEKRLPICKH